MPPNATKPKRRWFRFSLRTLLLLMTGLAILLTWHANEAARNRRAIALVNDLGGRLAYVAQYERDVGYTVELSSLRRWSMDTFGDEHFNEISWVDLNATDVADEDLQVFRKLPALRTLHLQNTRIGDRGIASLVGARGLENLTLHNTQITDEGLVDIAKFHELEILMLEGTNIGNDGLAHLTSLKRLRVLNLENTNVTDEGAQSLAQCQSLVSLILSGPNITDATLEQLEGLKNLENVLLKRTRVTPEGVERVQRAIPNCEIENITR